MPCIPRGTSFLFLPEPRLLSSSSSVLKTSFKSNFFFCFPGGGGGAVAAAFGVLGCCCAGEFQLFTAASTNPTYFYSIWREATPQIHTLQIYEDKLHCIQACTSINNYRMRSENMILFQSSFKNILFLWNQ